MWDCADRLEREAEAEAEAVRARYLRRAKLPPDLYSAFRPDVLLAQQGRERAIVHCLKETQLIDVGRRSLLEIGCGGGGGLMQFLRLGFRPEHLAGNELIDERIAVARSLLPPTVRLFQGDACRIDLGTEQFDIVHQSTVFSSILNREVQDFLAQRMWSLVKPGGGVLWYDFVYNNPHNPDVRGVPLARVNALFPEGRLRYWRVTLAPPLGRVLAPIHPLLYSAFNAIPWLRTHVVCWIVKP